MAKQWYVVHTYSGYENKVKDMLEERIEAYSMQDLFADILIPTEEVEEIIKGKKGEKQVRKTSKKFFPGYLLVNMEMNNETWHLVKDTPRVTGFIGGKTKPIPIPDGGMDAGGISKFSLEKRQHGLQYLRVQGRCCTVIQINVAGHRHSPLKTWSRSTGSST